MNLPDVVRLFVGPALYLLPTKFTSPGAEAMLLAIGLQESGLDDRHQDGGPAHGYWQFEKFGGVSGVLEHRLTRNIALNVLDRMDYDAEYVINSELIHTVIEHNQIVACVFARLLLFTVPDRLPTRDEPDVGWQQYMFAWRPGKPHPERWLDNWRAAWQQVG